ncbi:MAG TPA: GreA/GreB family elongation factor [Waddliaceae bacterium]
MSYLEEFQNQINNRDFHKFFQLWEEYCTNDHVEAIEFIKLLDMIKRSEFAKLFGQFAETTLPLWKTIQDSNDSYEVLKRIIDVQTTNTPLLADTSFQMLKERYGGDPKFNERIRQVGLRSHKTFEGAISKYELLAHMQKGKFVFHPGGWGTGEVMDISSLREQVSVEFENVSGVKHFIFENAFKALLPINDEHFLARRFANPDQLEKEARDDANGIVKMLLRDLGPKTASEIKDELCELVIPEKDWAKWWQSARTKLKKDPLVETPASLGDPLKLRESEISHEEHMQRSLQEKTGLTDIIQASYSFVREMPQMFRKPEIKDSIKQKLVELLSHQDLTPIQELQIYLFLESLFNYQIEGKNLKETIQSITDISSIIDKIDILAFKKLALTHVKQYRSDWKDIFSSMLLTIQPNALKDYIFGELNQQETQSLILDLLKDLLKHPEKNPEVFFWYFQKISKKSPDKVPYSDKEGQCQFLESFLILLNKIEGDYTYRELSKKIYNHLSARRYEVVRTLIEGTSLDFIKEFLLLVAKCHIFTDHDKKIMVSLAQVVHPSLAPPKKRSASHLDPNILWTTNDGYRKTQARLKQIATVEMVENAREVEAARALGDLRENSEYRFAVERRSRLQREMKELSKQFNKARILTPDDIYPDEVNVGSVVDLEDSRGKKITYTILGPWEANPDDSIISYQSQFAQALSGNKVGDSIKFKDEEYAIIGLRSFFDNERMEA